MWRLSKYDPSLRDQDGIYQSDDWTHISDLGKVFGGRRLENCDYLEVENACVEAILSFFQAANIQELCVQKLEKHGNWPLVSVEYRMGLPSVLPEYELGMFVSVTDLDCFIRLALRGILWGELVNKIHDAYLHFGYDFYVYVGAKGDGLGQWNPPQGIFAEAMVSPYLD